jgi:uncharacterized protein YbjQ (UPF0145 family)
MGTLDLILLLLPFGLVALGYSIGRRRERNHIRSLDRREAALDDIITTDLKRIPDPGNVAEARLVMGEAVMATDYFKSFAAGLRNLVGGEVSALEVLVRRARREASIRMLEQAQQMGATEVHNIRFETSNVLSAGGRSKSISAEMFAYGTAIVRRR